MAAEDWAPVPVSASASPKSWADWLAEEPAPEPQRAPPPSRTPTRDLGLRLMGHSPAAEAPPARPQTGPMPAAARPAPGPVRAAPPATGPVRAVAPAAAPTGGASYSRYLTPEERAIVEAQQTRPTATATAPQGRRRPRTDELLKLYGDHLTPEEVAILEKQLD